MEYRGAQPPGRSDAGEQIGSIRNFSGWWKTMVTSAASAPTSSQTAATTAGMEAVRSRSNQATAALEESRAASCSIAGVEWITVKTSAWRSRWLPDHAMARGGCGSGCFGAAGSRAGRGRAGGSWRVAGRAGEA